MERVTLFSAVLVIGLALSTERAEILEYARKVCRDSFRASSTVNKIDDRKRRVTCLPPGS